MRYIIFTEPKKLFSFTIPEASEKQLAAVTESFLLTQLDRGFGSLEYWKTLFYKLNP